MGLTRILHAVRLNKRRTNQTPCTDALGTGDGDASGVSRRRRSRLWRCRLFSVVVAAGVVVRLQGVCVHADRVTDGAQKL